MTDLLRVIFAVLASLFKSRAEVEAENLVLRQQVNVLRRRMPKGPALTNIDRLLFVWLYRWFPPRQALSRSSGRKQSFAGTALAFAPIGGGDLAAVLADRRSHMNCARSSLR